MKRKTVFVFILALILNISPISIILMTDDAEAKVTIREGDYGKISVEGEVAIRYEYWDWFQSSGSEADNSYDYIFLRSRLGLEYENPALRAYIQVQNVNMLSLPENSLAAAPQGPLGIGAIYHLHNRVDNPHSLIIRQAYIDFPDIFSSSVTARIGRFDYVDGTEVMYDNPKVNQIKNIRLSERLIGPFGWSSYTRSFDGLQLTYDNESMNLHSSITRPTQGGFENSAHKTISDIDLFTLTATMKFNKVFSDTEMRFFYYYYGDDRHITSTPGQSGLDEGKIRINTLGTHWLKLWKTSDGIFDTLFWGAYQNGDWGAVDHQAWAVDFEAGYQFVNLPWKPWLRIGYFMSSGDSNPSDGKHETFYQLLPTARKYALFPFYNMMNNKDFFIQGIVRPLNNLTVRADLHFLRLTEKNDLWYMGAGPTVEKGSIFGYIGRPSGGSGDLGRVIDLVASYTFNKNISGTVYYGRAFGGDVIGDIYQGNKNANFFYMEMEVSF